MSTLHRRLAAVAAGTVVLVVSHAVRGQAPSSEPVPVLVITRVEEFLDALSMQEYQDAFDEIMAESYFDPQSDEVTQLIDETQDVLEGGPYGRFVRWEQLEARRVGRSLVFLKYLYCCERLPLVWHFTFYDATGDGTRWQLVNIRFDVDLEALIE